MIELRNVGLDFGAFTALDGISFDVAKAACVVICGPSGSGKSALLRYINGLEDFQRGDVLVEGVSVRTTPDLPALRRQIGMVSQHFELYPHMTVLENVTLAPIKAKGIAKADAIRSARLYLDRVGILDQADKFPARLSGGQQQRAAIARSLALEPKVMLDLSRSGMTMIVVTHEMGFAQAVADEVIFMDHGHIVERSPTAAFFQQPSSDRAREFLDRVLVKL